MYLPTYFDRYSSECAASLSLSAVQPELVEPLSLADVKQYLRVDYTDDDMLLGTFISGAREQAEYMQGRVLVQKSFDLTMDGLWPWKPIELLSPLTSVALVQSTAPDGTVTTLTAGTNYRTDSAKQSICLFSVPQPAPHSTLLVRFTAGHAPTNPFWQHKGARLKAGMLLLISAWYGNRLPFATGITTANEYPYAVTHCLTAGSLRRAR